MSLRSSTAGVTATTAALIAIGMTVGAITEATGGPENIAAGTVATMTAGGILSLHLVPARSLAAQSIIRPLGAKRCRVATFSGAQIGIAPIAPPTIPTCRVLA